VQPVNGIIMRSDAPGLAMELDEAKIEEQRLSPGPRRAGPSWMRGGEPSGV